MTQKVTTSSSVGTAAAAAAVAVAASLDAPVPLAFINTFLSVRDLLALRAVNRNCLCILPLHTRELVGTKLNDPRALPLLATYFPHVTTFTLHGCKLPDEALRHALECIAGKWTQLRALTLSTVWYLKDAHVHLCSQRYSATLESLVITHCYQIKTPTIECPRLRRLSIKNCFFTQFGAETHFPMLQELLIESQVLSTPHVRHLIKRTLVKSAAPPLQVLSLANCGAVTQVLIDPIELPSLKTLDLKSCHGLERVHVASQSLENLSLSLCVELQHVILDLGKVQSVDLSYLKVMTHLFLRAESLQALSLVGCSQIEIQHLKVSCPELQFAYLSGANVKLEDLNSMEQDMTIVS